MKIAHIVECAGGVEKYLEMLTPLLMAKGYEQCLICSNSFSIEKFKDKVNDIILLDMKQTFNPIKVYHICKQVRTALRDYSPDIIYCHSSFGGVYGRIAAIGSRVKCVYNPHGWAFNMKKGKSSVFKMVERVLSFLTDDVVCISKAEMESAIRAGIGKHTHLQLIPNGIDIRMVTNAIPVDREKLGIGKNTFVVGMVGRISPQKAPDTFIQAAKMIHDHIPNSFFIIVGQGELAKEIKKMAEAYHVPLLITGWVENAYSYLKIFDIALLLSRWEGFGLAVVEYMAAKKNIVATKADAIPTLVADGIDGVLVDIDSPSQVAEAVFWLREHPIEAAGMKQKAWIKVNKNYDIVRVAQQHDELFHSIVKVQ